MSISSDKDLAYIQQAVLGSSNAGQPPKRPQTWRERVIIDGDSTSSDDSPNEADMQLDNEDEEQEQEQDLQCPYKLEEFIRGEEADLLYPAEIEASVAIQFVGVVFGTLANQIVIKSTVVHTSLDKGTLLCSEERRVIGRIYDTFGPVENPFYLLLSTFAVACGERVFFAPGLAKTICTADMLKQRGCDASGQQDQEDANAEPSDDEEEARQKRKRKLQAPLEANQPLEYGEATAAFQQDAGYAPTSAIKPFNI